MPIRDWLLSMQTPPPSDHGDTETVVRIVRELDKLELRRARYLAAFAYLLSRVAGADENISEAETRTMIGLVERHSRLPRSQAALVVEIAKNQNELFRGTEDALITREFKELSTEEDRRDLLDCLFVVSDADAQASRAENIQMQRIATELGFVIEDYVRARLARRR